MIIAFKVSGDPQLVHKRTVKNLLKGEYIQQHYIIAAQKTPR